VRKWTHTHTHRIGSGNAREGMAAGRADLTRQCYGENAALVAAKLVPSRETRPGLVELLRNCFKACFIRVKSVRTRTRGRHSVILRLRIGVGSRARKSFKDLG